MNERKPSLMVVTYLPSPYQVELLNAIADAGACDLFVLYLRKQESTPVASRWELPKIQHAHDFADNAVFELTSLLERTNSADLLVVNFYQHPVAQSLLARRNKSQKRWAFWGERPGATGRRPLGKIVRRWYLRSLHSSRTPIWGIGAWAVAAWQTEFGFNRVYHDVPYFSDLSRFAKPTVKVKPDSNESIRFLFVGSLIERKGCDLIAAAFSRIAHEFPDAELHWAGNGPLEATLREAMRPSGDHVKFHGFCPWGSLPDVYSRADVLLAPSRYDGWALVVPEGLAAGLPVIGTTRMGAAIELVRHGENGWLIAPDDGDSLYRSMKLAASKSHQERLIMRNSATVSVSRHQLADGVTRFLGAVESALL